MHRVKVVICFLIYSLVLNDNYIICFPAAIQFLEKILFLSHDFTPSKSKTPDPSPRQTTDDLIREAGYPAERHEVTTEDRYWLTIHRIPRGKGKPPESNKIPVILQHGLLGSSASWVLHRPENSLGFILADDGYDVWIPNVRGNTYSRQHDFLDPEEDSPRFWDFSFHEMGTRDMPAIIDYILNSTGQSQVLYVGHSMGTTIVYILLSSRPEYNNKIKMFITMAPIAYLEHVQSPIIQSLTLLDPVLLSSFLSYGMYEILPHNEWSEFVTKHICNKNALAYSVCTTVMQSLSGFDPKQLDTNIFSRIMTHFPAGTSVKVLQHYAQLIKGGKFCQYDYGWKSNYKHYGSLRPPDYNLTNVVAPNLMYIAQNDWLSSREDVDKLFDELPHVIGKEIIRYKKFNHLDFLFAIDVKKLVYNSLVSVLDRYRSLNNFNNNN